MELGVVWEAVSEIGRENWAHGKRRSGAGMENWDDLILPSGMENWSPSSSS